MRPGLDLDHPLAPLHKPVFQAFDPPAPKADERPLFPWEDRSLGLWTSLGRTLKGALFSPARFFREHRGGPGAAAPFVFGLAAGSTGLMLVLFVSFAESTLSPPSSNWIRPGSGTGAAGRAALILGTPLAVLAWLAFQAVWSHFWLMVFGAGSKGIKATTRALGYSMSASVFAWLPYIGPLLSTIWGLTIWVVGLSRLQERSLLRIGAALFVPPLGFFILSAYLGGGFG